jgi:hypothetical protein
VISSSFKEVLISSSDTFFPALEAPSVALSLLFSWMISLIMSQLISLLLVVRAIEAGLGLLRKRSLDILVLLFLFFLSLERDEEKNPS